MIMRRRLAADIVKTLPALALCLQLAACAQQDVGHPPDVTPPAKPVVAAPVEKPAVLPAKPQHQASPPVARPAKTPPASPEELVGLGESGVRTLLGAPAETRTDGAARIFTYHSAACSLDVIFFMDLMAGDLRVLSYQWNGNGGRMQTAKSCYPELRVAQ